MTNILQIQPRNGTQLSFIMQFVRQSSNFRILCLSNINVVFFLRFKVLLCNTYIMLI